VKAVIGCEDGVTKCFPLFQGWRYEDVKIREGNKRAAYYRSGMLLGGQAYDVGDGLR
jgi:hypothetical protein